MIIELHVLQNFVPANLNRDDTGSPKDCTFGGYLRARISSQCFKRAIRTEFRQAALLSPTQLAQRTGLVQDAIAGRLVAFGHGVTEAQHAAAHALDALGIKANPQHAERTSYLFFLAPHELDRVAQIIHTHWENFPRTPIEPAKEAPPARERGRKKTETSPVPAPALTAIKGALDGKQAADLALFGRMIADLPKSNVEAACQVAHAISTHRVEAEFDFYTAVDDLQPNDTTGASMLGVVEFNSACFYRYANVDTVQLTKNLGGDSDLVIQTIGAFIQAMIHAIPTGKQNSMAAHNLPSLVLAVARERGQWNLANAFLQPIAPRADADLMVGSIKALDTYWEKLVGMYGTQGILGQWVATMEDKTLQSLQPARTDSVDVLVQAVLAHTTGEHSR